jgi:hypothetical protein
LVRKSMKRRPLVLASSIALITGDCGVSLADQPAPRADHGEDLVEQAENPISRLFSVPFQSNLNFGVGPGRDLQYVLNVQPVLPMSLAEDWNLIHRPIIPIIAQPELTVGQGGAFGLGDVQYQLYLSPAGTPHFVWGIGPVFSFATATDTLLGSGRSSVGPGVVVLGEPRPWLLGVLMNQIWSYSANPQSESVTRMSIQPFIDFNFADEWYLAASPVMTANWKAVSGQKWTIPLGGGIGKIVHLGGLPVNLQVQAFWTAGHPDSGPRWSLRPQFQFLFPRGPR